MMINSILRKSLVTQMTTDTIANNLSNVAQLFAKFKVPRTAFDYITITTIFHYIHLVSE